MSQNYRAYLSGVERRFGLPSGVLYSLAQAESNFNPTARSSAGALGMFQLMPATARSVGVRDPFNWQQSAVGAGRYLQQQLRSFGGNLSYALAAYNAGPGAVRKYNGIPPYAETRNYVRRVTDGMGGATPQQQAQARQQSVVNAPQLLPPAEHKSLSPTAVHAFNVAHAGTEDGSENLLTLAQNRLDRQYESAQSRINKENQKRMEGYYRDWFAANGGNHSMNGGGYYGPNGAPPPAGGRDWRYLQQLGSSMFGLRNDPGNSQTYGGHHSNNSRHYMGAAIDFGTARNSRQQLNSWYQWALANQKKYGFNEVLDEGDHIHVSF